jgi:hypothetical protein
MDIYGGSIVGAVGGTMTIQSGGLVRNFHGSTISSNVTVNAGGELRSLGGAYRGTITNSGTNSFQATEQVASLVVGAAAPTVGAGQVGIGNGTATTATAGAQTLPANPAGFLVININGTLQKIPYYNS